MSRPDEENQDEQGEEQFDDQTADHGDYNLIPQHQPQQFQQVNQNPPVSQKPQAKPEDWNTELFGCLEDPSNALITAFFPCVTFGQIAEIIDNGHSSKLSTHELDDMYLLPVIVTELICYSNRTDEIRLLLKALDVKNKRLGWQGNLSLQQQNYPMTPPANPGMMHK
ncbi:hypothetical protein AgCh_008184 [Apium graveolens]